MIKLSKKGSYALKAVIYIGNNDKLVHIYDISSDLGISETLLRRIIANLEKTGILKTIKGRKGGVKLGRELNKISIYDILNSVGEELGISDCTSGKYCDKKDICPTTYVLNNLQKGFNSLLKINTLDKIMK